MPSFYYEAADSQGKKIKGFYAASSKQAAINELKGKGFTLRSIVEKKQTALSTEISIGRAVKLQEFVIFCRQFATLIRSGIQVDQALSIMEDQTTDKKLKAAIIDVHDQIRNGHSLSKALAEHPKIFPDMFTNMVNSGESGGHLDDVLDRMADHYEKENKTIQKIKSAMTYPIILIFVAIGVVIFLLMSVVPTFASMFAEMGEELPLITRAVMSASDIILHYWWAVLIVVVGIIVGIRFYLSTDEGRYQYDKFKFQIPVFGPVFKKAAIARLTRTMSSLYTSGVAVLQTLDITSRVVGNKVISKVLLDSKQSLQEGKLLSEPFAKSGMFPPMVIQMVIVGEETGQLDSMMGKVADFFESDVDQSVDRLKAIVEPMMLLLVACLVGIIVAAIMSPMFKMYDNFLK
ncbi:type II secretion system F family protein [Paenibacillus dokdonensis]|uniref:type II secretion system F family protein n=1 Tax=Paenibacillus dokdonensis TaxID=2567944 RepID=UPI0010A8B892|nr:type II secretion system F family protein [Paenibacillus dokdonensis]